MKLFGIIGVWEALIIVVIIAVIFGPRLFIKARKRVKDTGEAAKKGLKAGAEKAGIDIDGVNEDGSKKSAVDHINDFQDRVDKWLDDKGELETDEQKQE